MHDITDYIIGINVNASWSMQQLLVPAAVYDRMSGAVH